MRRTPAARTYTPAVHVVIVGCGRVGSSLARVLTRDGHSVAIIDRRADSFVRLGADFAGRTVQGIGFDRDRLIEAGIEDAGAVAAVTSGDNSNILVARVARENFGIEQVVARIYDPRRAVVYQRLGIPTVATVTWTTDQVIRRLFPETTSVEWTDAGGAVRLVERSLPDGWAGHKLAALNETDQYRLAAISRAGQARIAAGDLVGQEGDILHLLVRADALDALETRLAAGAEGAH